jgi:hypothetical protein
MQQQAGGEKDEHAFPSNVRHVGTPTVDLGLFSSGEPALRCAVMASG